MNFVIVPAVALIPLLIGFIWYHPKVFGNAWIKASKMIEEKPSGAKMAKIFGLTYLLSLLFTIGLMPIVIHQMHIFSLLAAGTEIKDPTSEHSLMFKKIMVTFGNEFRTFKHGAFHGVLAGFFVVLPILGINALFERKGFKYIAINVGYWIITMALMGGILCAFMKID